MLVRHFVRICPLGARASINLVPLSWSCVSCERVGVDRISRAMGVVVLSLSLATLRQPLHYKVERISLHWGLTHSVLYVLSARHGAMHSIYSSEASF